MRDHLLILEYDNNALSPSNDAFLAQHTRWAVSSQKLKARRDTIRKREDDRRQVGNLQKPDDIYNTLVTEIRQGVDSIKAGS